MTALRVRQKLANLVISTTQQFLVTCSPSVYSDRSELVNSELETEPSKSPGQELREHLENKVHWKLIGFWLLVGLCVLIAVVWFGRHGADQIKAMEAWVAGHGVVGWIVFVGMMIVLMSVFVPDTVLALAAGAMFGLGLGTVLCFIACTLTAVINFLTARWLLRPRIEQMIQGQPKLVAIERAAEREGLRLLLLLRLAPLTRGDGQLLVGHIGCPFSAIPGRHGWADSMAAR